MSFLKRSRLPAGAPLLQKEGRFGKIKYMYKVLIIADWKAGVLQTPFPTFPHGGRRRYRMDINILENLKTSLSPLGETGKGV